MITGFISWRRNLNYLTTPPHTHTHTSNSVTECYQKWKCNFPTEIFDFFKMNSKKYENRKYMGLCHKGRCLNLTGDTFFAWLLNKLYLIIKEKKRFLRTSIYPMILYSFHYHKKFHGLFICSFIHIELLRSGVHEEIFQFCMDRLSNLI